MNLYHDMQFIDQNVLCQGWSSDVREAYFFTWELTPTAVTRTLPLPSITWVPERTIGSTDTPLFTWNRSFEILQAHMRAVIGNGGKWWGADFKESFPQHLEKKGQHLQKKGQHLQQQKKGQEDISLSPKALVVPMLLFKINENLGHYSHSVICETQIPRLYVISPKLTLIYKVAQVSPDIFNILTCEVFQLLKDRVLGWFVPGLIRQ